ncbi:hypothetical protein FHS82_000826 [Pseudochelatococcus lubricantis]|uniref:Uncharacterized protein n=1 Tax=Pseudochelatococcus lubricantis TaxID=1538102 RepID=A0ABX0UYN3_9HYPH|nr:hypothetical protein [Pseudochelatococcus lubricantis]
MFGTGSGLDARLQDLATAIDTRFEIHVVRAAQLARVLVLDIGRVSQRIGGTAVAAFCWRGFSFWNGHNSTPINGDDPAIRTQPIHVQISMGCGLLQDSIPFGQRFLTVAAAIRDSRAAAVAVRRPCLMERALRLKRFQAKWVPVCMKKARNIKNL